jgi:uncharacterized membrane protein
MDSHRKSVFKAVTWRIVGSVDTFVISWLVTGSAKMGVAISAIEVVTKIVLYYFHERAWSRVK